MDISVNENVIEKVKLRDIFASLRNIIASNIISEDENTTNKKLEEIYKVEKELGATASIEKLIKNLETRNVSKKKKVNEKAKKLSKVNKITIEQAINLSEEQEIQEEGKEL